jgi:hypothetical protein
MVINPVRPDEWKLLEPLLGAHSNSHRLTMLELGNKLNTQCGPLLNQTVTYKRFFTARGYLHVSVDTNGKDGALALDLREPLGLKLQEAGKPQQYDVITNIGTTEHVEGEQEQVWNNIWAALSPGGWLLSITPRPGDWWWHGHWYPTADFYATLGRENFEDVTLGTYGGKDRVNLTFVGRRPRDSRHFKYPGNDLLFFNKMRRIK